MVAVIGLIVYAVNCYIVSSIEITSAPDSILKETHPIEKAKIWAQ